MSSIFGGKILKIDSTKLKQRVKMPLLYIATKLKQWGKLKRSKMSFLCITRML
jgi:hypothetical protein